MRFSAPIIAYFFSINNMCKIHPINNINNAFTTTTMMNIDINQTKEKHKTIKSILI